MERTIVDVVAVYKEKADEMPVLIAEYSELTIGQNKDLVINSGETTIIIQNWSHYYCSRIDKKKFDISVVDQYV